MNAFNQIRPSPTGPTVPPSAPPPIVLRFAGLHPGSLGRFRMHDRRQGGDLTHVDADHSRMNRVEFGEPDWIEDLRTEIADASRANLENHVTALNAKSRRKEAARVTEEGLVDPWRRCQDGPLREGILTVNKDWFGGTGANEWDGDRVCAFRAHAMAFLREHFPEAQLRFASSHADEESFHLHFVVAVWTEKHTANRGMQRLLQASTNPLLADYEHAQDLAGAHFEEIGLCRGVRRAEARRQAKAEGRVLEPKPRHVSPSRYRAEARRKAASEKARLLAQAAEKAEEIARDARDLGTATIRKSRKRAVREARARKEAARQEEIAAIARRDTAAHMAETERKAAHAAMTLKERTEVEIASMTARAGQIAAAVKKDVGQVQSLRAAKAELDARLARVVNSVEIVERKHERVVQALKAAQRAELQHRENIGQLRAEATDLQAGNEKIVARAGALEDGLDMVAAGQIEWKHDQAEGKGRLVFGSQAPRDEAGRRTIARTVKVAGPWLSRLARFVRAAVDNALMRERRKLARDVATLAAIRDEMGLPVEDRLARMRRAYDHDAEDPGLDM